MPTTIGSNDIETILVAIATLNHDDLIEQFQIYPAPFPVDFTETFLRAQPIDKLRHVFAGLVLHCRIAPAFRALAASAA